MEDRRLTQDSQSGRGGRAASLVVVALLLILLVATSSAGAATTKASPIRLGALPPQQPHADQPFSAQLNVTGGVAPYSYEAPGDLPEGLSLTGSGELVGEPTAAGSFLFRVIAHDREGHSASRDYTLKIELTVPPMSIQTWVGAEEIVPLEVLGTGGPDVFRVARKNLPPGLWLYEEHGSGLLVGTPSKTGTYTLPVAVTDPFKRVKGNGSETVHVWGTNIPVAFHKFHELNGPTFEGNLFTPEAEANGVISGSTTVIEDGRFTYSTHTELLYLYGPGVEYGLICEPAATKCSGPSPHGEAFLTA